MFGDFLEGHNTEEPWGPETDPSESALRESEEGDFGEALADSVSAGQETASMTDTTSIALFDGIFQAGFFPREIANASAAFPLPPCSDPAEERGDWVSKDGFSGDRPDSALGEGSPTCSCSPQTTCDEEGEILGITGEELLSTVDAIAGKEWINVLGLRSEEDGDKGSGEYR